jgi:ATP-dependent Lon protease
VATSLLSLALEKPLTLAIAMTGELTVTGKVLRIAVFVKYCCSPVSGIKDDHLPDNNMSDWLHDAHKS